MSLRVYHMGTYSTTVKKLASSRGRSFVAAECSRWIINIKKRYKPKLVTVKLEMVSQKELSSKSQP